MGATASKVPELDQADFNFDERTYIAKGKFGGVFSVDYKGKRVAMKQPHGSDATCREAEIVANLKHENVITFYGVVYYNSRQCPTFELADGSVEDFVITNTKPITLTMERRHKWTHDIAQGVRYLHDDVSIFHGDIKSANVLIFGLSEGLGTAKLGDFGLSVNLTASASCNGEGTPYYSAPEILSPFKAQKSLKSDVWSYAATVVEIYTEKRPYFFWPDRTDLLYNVRHGKITPLSTLPDEQLEKLPAYIQRLLNGSFHHDRSWRWPMKQIIAVLDRAHVDVVQSEALMPRRDRLLASGTDGKTDFGDKRATDAVDQPQSPEMLRTEDLVAIIENEIKDYFLTLAAAGIDFNVKNGNENSAFQFTALMSNRETIRTLVEAAATANIQNSNGNTALHLVALMNNEESTLALIEAGADVNIQNNSGCTALHLAAASNSKEIIRVLAEARADLNIQDRNGHAALYTAVLRNHTDSALTLIEAGANVRAKADDAFAPLHAVALVNSKELALALIEHGADVNSCNRKRLTPLHLAAFHNNREIAEVLIQFGADFNNREWIVNPLQMAAMNNSTDVALRLIQFGMDVDRLSAFCLTPSQVTLLCWSNAGRPTLVGGWK